MAAPVAELRTELSASVARFQKDFKRSQNVVRSSSRGMGNSFRNLSKSSTGLSNSIFNLRGGITALVSTAVLGGAINKFLEFDKGLREVGTLMGGLSDDEMKRMGDELKNISVQSGQALDTLVKARYDIVSAGFSDAADSAELLRVSADLAVGGVADVATTADLLTTAVNAYGLEAENAAEVSDKLFTIVRLGKTTVTELAGSMGRLLAIASTMNVDLDEVGAALATLTANGQKTEEAVTAIRAAIVEFSKPGKELAEALKSVGIESGEALIKSEGLEGALKKINEAAIKNNTTIIQLLSNVRSMQAVLPLATTAAGEFAGNLDEMEGSAGATQKALEEMEKSGALALSKIKKEIDLVVLDITTSLLPSILKGAKAFALLIPGSVMQQISLLKTRIFNIQSQIESFEAGRRKKFSIIDVDNLNTARIALAEAQLTLADLTGDTEAADAALLKLNMLFGNVTDTVPGTTKKVIELEESNEGLADSSNEAADGVENLTVNLAEQEKVAKEAKKALDANRDSADNMTESFLRSVDAGKSLADTLIDLAKSALFKFAAKAVATAFFPAAAPVIAAAADGGIIGGPSLLATPSGVVEAGEAGEEGIFPLTRVGGQLGLKTEGAGSTTINKNEFNFNGPTNRELIENEVVPMIEEMARAGSTQITSLRDFDQGDQGLEIKRAPQ